MRSYATRKHVLKPNACLETITSGKLLEPSAYKLFRVLDSLRLLDPGEPAAEVLTVPVNKIKKRLCVTGLEKAQRQAFI